MQTTVSSFLRWPRSLSLEFSANVNWSLSLRCSQPTLGGPFLCYKPIRATSLARLPWYFCYYSQTCSKDHLLMKTIFYRSPGAYFLLHWTCVWKPPVYKDHILLLPRRVFIYKLHCTWHTYHTFHKRTCYMPVWLAHSLSSPPAALSPHPVSVASHRHWSPQH